MIGGSAEGRYTSPGLQAATEQDRGRAKVHTTCDTHQQVPPHEQTVAMIIIACGACSRYMREVKTGLNAVVLCG
jgi:hypothetical protein